MLSYRRETALQGALVLAKSGRLQLEDNILPVMGINYSKSSLTTITFSITL